MRFGRSGRYLAQRYPLDRVLDQVPLLVHDECKEANWKDRLLADVLGCMQVLY